MISQIKEQVTTQQIIYLVALAGLSSVFTGLILLGNSYQQRMFPNTYINNIDVSGLSLSDTLKLLEDHRIELDSHEFILSIDDISLASSSADLGYTTNFSKAVNQVYTQQHTQNRFSNIFSSLLSYLKRHEYEADKKYDDSRLKDFLSIFNQKVKLIGENPSVELKVFGSPNSIVVSQGIPGREVNNLETSELILEALQSDNHKIEAKIASTSSILNDEEIESTIKEASKFVGKKLTLIADDKKYYINDKDLIYYINPLGGYIDNNIIHHLTEFSESVDRDPQNAVFDYDKESLKVSEFKPHRDGLEVDINSSKDLIISWLNDTKDNSDDENIPETLSLILKRTSPEITLDQTNDLGIKERIGFGESYYDHSIPNRIHNVAITNNKVNLTIVPPGEEFSFNKTLGEVSKATGYRSAYVISGGKTVLGDGGGVCQVSSTTFRAVLDAGLDVSKRLQHSYRVSYYELNSNPGFDATVYAGDVDFRFVNDTDNHIILLYQNDPDELYMNVEIYGTNDGRVSNISNYKKWGQVGAPAPEYYPTSDLPTGVTKQVDWAVAGIKTEFQHTVKDKDGNIIHDDKYYSYYRPWSAKYMIGI